MKVFFIILLLVSSVVCAPWLDILFNQQPSYNNDRTIDYYKNQQYRRRQGKGGKDRWKEICRTINADPYAFPGRVPYPSAPVCPW